MDRTDKAGIIIIVVILVAFSFLMYFVGYEVGQTDALGGKWKYEVDSTHVEAKRINN